SETTPTTLLWPLSLHDALPISQMGRDHARQLLRAQPVHEKGKVRAVLLDRAQRKHDHRLRVARQLGRFLEGALGEPDHSDRSGRSEEHTSELQSRVDLVCGLLL